MKHSALGSECLLILFFSLYFQPVVIERISEQLDVCFRTSSVIFFLLIVFIKTIRKKKIVLNSRFNIAFSIFVIWDLMCILIMAPNKVLDFIKELFYIAEFGVVLNLYSDEKESVWNSLAIVSIVYIIINAITLCIFPRGFFMSYLGSSIERSQWILGSKNNIALYAILFLMFIHVKTRSINKIMLFLIDIITFLTVACSGSSGLKFMGGSSTGIAACGICIILLLLNSNDKLNVLKPILNMKSCIIILFLLNIIFLYGTIPFGNYISGLFNKKLVYGGRIPIWQSSLHYIKESLLCGYGYNKAGYRLFNGSKMIFTTYTYNTALGIMIRYGLISLLLLLIIFISVKRNKSFEYRICMCIFFSLGIWGIMNELDLRYIFIPLLCLEFIEPESVDIKKQKTNVIAIVKKIG